MNCKTCNCSAMEKMLHRTNPLGQIDAGWMCMVCIQINEKELAEGIKSDEDFNVLKDVEDAVLGRN